MLFLPLSVCAADNIIMPSEYIDLIPTTLSQNTSDGVSISVEGNMPENTSLSVVPDHNFTQLEDIIADENFIIDAAFDISLESEGEAYQPVEYGETVFLSLANLGLSATSDVVVYRIDNQAGVSPESNDAVTELHADITDDGVVNIETEHFTTYVFGHTTISTDDSISYLKPGTEINASLQELNPAKIVFVNEHYNINNLDLNSDILGSSGEVRLQNIALISEAGAQTWIAEPYIITDDPVTPSLPMNIDRNQPGIYYIIVPDKAYLNEDSSKLFSNLSNLITIANMETYVDTSLCQNFNAMFKNCESLQNINLSGFDTNAATTYYDMFAGCNALETLDLSAFDMQNADASSSWSWFYGTPPATITELKDFTSPINIPNQCMGYSFPQFSGHNWYLDDNYNNIADNITSIGYSPIYNSPTPHHYIREDKEGLRVISEATLVTGKAFNAAIKQLSDNGTTYTSNAYTYAENSAGLGVIENTITDIIWTDEDISNASDAINISTDNNAPVYASKSVDSNGDIVIKLYTEADQVYFNEDSSSMFATMSGLKHISFIESPKINTSRVTTMEKMFSGVYNYWSGWWAYTATSMHLVSLDLSYFDTSSVTNMSSMFRSCTELLTLELSSFNTEEVTDMSAMFMDCNKLNNIDLSSFRTPNVTTMDCMFYQATVLTTKDSETIDVSTFNTSKVTSFGQMFRGTHAVTYLDLRNFDVSHTSSLYGMFWACWATEIIGLEDWDVHNVTNISYTFANSGLHTVDLSKWDMPNLVNVDRAFSVMYGVSVIDLSSLDFSKINNVWAPFDDCRARTIKTPKNVPAGKNIGLYGSDWYIDDKPPQLTADSKTAISHLPEEDPISHTIIKSDIAGFKPCPDATLLPGQAFNETIRVLSGEDDYTNSVDNLNTTITAIEWTEIPFESDVVVSTSTSEAPVYAKFDNGIITLYSYADKVYMNQNCLQMFFGLTNLTSLPLERYDSSRVTVFSNAFRQLRSVRRLDLSSFDASNVTTFYCAFMSDSSLEELILPDCSSGSLKTNGIVFTFSDIGVENLDLSSWNTENIDSLYGTFYGAKHLKHIQFGENFKTSNVTNMEQTFYNTALESLDISTFDTSKVTKFYAMCWGCKNLTHVDISSFIYKDGANVSNMFTRCSALKFLDISSMDLSSVKNGTTVIRDCAALQTIIAPKTIPEESVITLPTSADYMWYLDDNEPLDQADSAQAYTQIISGVTNLSHRYIRSDKENFTEFIPSEAYLINGRDFNVALRTLAGDSQLDYTKQDHELIYQILWISNPITDGVVLTTDDSPHQVYASYEPASRIIRLYTDAETVYTNPDSSYMFSKITALNKIDLSHFDTSKTTNMSYMFDTKYRTISLDLSTFDVSNVEHMDYMLSNIVMSGTFPGISTWQTPALLSANRMFSNSYLNSADLNNWDFSNNPSVTYMFAGSKVVSVTLPYNITSLSKGMFEDTKSLSLIYGGQSVTDISSNAFTLYSSNNKLLQFADYKDLTASCWGNYNWAGNYRQAMIYEVAVPARLDINHTGNFEVTIDKYIQNGTVKTGVNNYIVLQHNDNPSNTARFAILPDETDEIIYINNKHQTEDTISLSQTPWTQNHTTQTYNVPISLCPSPELQTGTYSGNLNLTFQGLP